MDTTYKTILTTLIIVFYILFPFSWAVNVYRLFQCDFEESYKGEIIHTLGVVSPTCIITAWSDWDE
jgi:hypothetical protein